MLRHIELTFIRIHILHHACREEIFGVGMMEELARHGYGIGPGLLYPLLARMEKDRYLVCRKRIVDHKQRKYYRATPKGRELLEEINSKITELYNEVINQ